MLSLLQRVVALVALLAFCPAVIQAQSQAPPASTFFLKETETQFSLNIANDSSRDVFIYFTSPAYSWVGVGFGDSMKNSLMVIMYPNSNGDNVTVSPRIADGHSEPSFTRDVQIEPLPGTGIQDDMFVLRARCRDCFVWPGGALDAKNTARNMIFAFGPGNQLQSNALDAPLKRHVRYGHFTMDMVAATGTGGVPANTTEQNGVSLQGGLVKDHDRANLAHTTMGCLALFVLWPLNVIFAGFFRNIKIHVGVSAFFMVFLVCAYGLGINTSFEYNRSKAFNSPHQIIAFLSIIPILLMSLLPIRQIANAHKIIPRLHMPLTTLTFVLLVLAGGLGLRLSNQVTPIILGYTAVALAVFAFIMIIQTCVKRRGSAFARATTRRRLGEEDDRDLMLAQYYANRKLDDESRSGSAASFNSHNRSGSANGSNIYGGGTMPGPQYLMNMHPGVPVYNLGAQRD